MGFGRIEAPVPRGVLRRTVDPWFDAHFAEADRPPGNRINYLG